MHHRLSVLRRGLAVIGVRLGRSRARGILGLGIF